MNRIKIIIVILVLFALPFLGRVGLPVRADSLAINSVDDLEKQIQEKQKQIQELEKQVAQYQEAIKGKQTEQSTLKKQIAFLESQINRLQSEIKLTEAQIANANLEITKLNYNIGEREKELNGQKSYLTNIIRVIDQYDQETPLELMLKNNNFSDFLNQVQYLENFQESVQAKADAIKVLKEQLSQQKQEQENLKFSLQSLNEDLQGKNLVLNEQKGDKSDLLQTTKNQEKKYQAMLSDLQKQRQEIEKEIYQLEDKLRLAIKPNALPTAKKGLLDWPVIGAITQTYGPTSVTGFVNNVYNFHNGVDVAASVGKPVKAALDGVISGVGNDGKYAYGRWLTINHQNGLTTLYGHLSVQKAAVGKQVKRGEVIGYSGSTGFSTGPHLHFTVYATNTFNIESRWFGLLPVGGSLNPMNYLE